MFDNSSKGQRKSTFRMYNCDESTKQPGMSHNELFCPQDVRLRVTRRLLRLRSADYPVRPRAPGPRMGSYCSEELI